ncbi:hypothetical protein VTO42DRAFT_4369 [Malbranchea cinnamomea]
MDRPDDDPSTRRELDSTVSVAGDEPPRKKRRKRRKVACDSCRRSKLKCDLSYPACGRCAKSGLDTCHYEDPPLWWQHRQKQQQQQQQQQQRPALEHAPLAEQPPQSAASNAAVPSRHSLVQNGSARVSIHDGPQQIERHPETVLLLNSHPPSPYITPKSCDTAACSPLRCSPSVQHERQHADDERSSHASRQRPTVPNKSLLGGKEHRTRFYGCSNVASLMSEFSDLTAFIKDIKANNPLLANIHRDIHASKNSKPSKPRLPELSLDGSFLRSLLPHRALVEALVAGYFNHVGNTHRILHRPSFCQELLTLWDPAVEAPASFVVQVFLVMAIVWSLEPPIEGSTLSGTKVKTYISWADAWLNTVEEKRPSLTVLQTRCLSLLAKQANYSQRNQAWSSAGTLVKLAMSAGYHRVPHPEAPISVFNREMRRRIWATVLELDLEASLDRGMPPTLQAEDYEYNPPLHINDEDIQESSTEFPTEKPLTTPTDTSFQVILHRSIGLRLRICALINAPRLSISAAELAELDDEIARYLADIPHWPVSTTEEESQRRRLILWRSLLEACLERSQLSLHGGCALAGLKGSFFSYSRRAALDVATLILCQQQLVLERIGRLGWYALTDVTFQAAVTVCHFLYSTDINQAPSVIRQMAPGLHDSLMSLVENMLPHLEKKFVTLEKGMREYAFLCGVIALTKTRLCPEAIADHQKQLVDRFSTISYGMMSRSAGNDGRRTIDQSSSTLQANSTSAIPHQPSSSQIQVQEASFPDLSSHGDWDFLMGDIANCFSGFDDLF